jgi:exodeoxyribonuclease-3
MRILSYNVNGIRSVISKGFIEWLSAESPDVICLQEVKALPEQFDQQLFTAIGYPHLHWFPAEKKGYSGVAILSKTAPDAVVIGCEHPLHDSEGRVIRADFGALSVFSLYFPSGTSGEERMGYKHIFNAYFQLFIEKLREERPNLVLCGDYNVAHEEIDIHSPKTNQKSAGFTPEERAWMTSHLASGFLDGFRELHPGVAHKYSWWSFRGGARANNKGWRIDYTVASEALRGELEAASIHDHIQFSDHAPIELVLKD